MRPLQEVIPRHHARGLVTGLSLGLVTAVASGQGFNYALQFNPAAQSVVKIGAAEGLGLDEWTVEAWFRIEGDPVDASTGWWGTRLAPIVAKGKDERTDGTDVDINYTMGIGHNDRLTADLEGIYVPEMQNGLPSGANHPVRASTAVSRNVWHHAAFTYDGETWRVYLDGRLDGWTVAELIPRSDSIQPVAIGAGRSWTGARAGFFDGTIDEVRIWDHARTAAEIRAGVNLEIETAPGLVGRWGMNEETGTTVFDSSGNDYHGDSLNTPRVPGAPFAIDFAPDVPVLVAPPDSDPVEGPVTLRVAVEDPEGSTLGVTFSGRPVAPPREDAFTIVVLPDTQFYSDFSGLDWIYRAMTQYAVDEVVDSNVKLVLHMGDLVNNDSDTEWVVADEAMSILETVPTLPYLMGVGNHDQSPHGDPCGTERFNTYFPFTRFDAAPWYGGHFEKDNDNSYVLFTVGNQDYIAISVEYNALPETIEWADGVLQQHAGRRAILVTHSMLNPFHHGRLGGVSEPEIWDGLKNNPNLFLVLCGHVWGEGHRVMMVGGRPVPIVITNYQERFLGGNGHLRLMELAPGDDAIRVRTFSPTLGTFERDADSEFWLNEDEPGGPWTTLGTVEDVPSGSEVAWTWPDLQDGQAYEWRVDLSDGARTETGPIWTFEVTFAPGDADGDGVVGTADILAVLAAWGTDDPNADVNDDGIVDFGDVLLVIAHWS